MTFGLPAPAPTNRSNQEILAACRRWLLSLNGTVSADDVRIWIEAQADRVEIMSRSLNWMGSVFRGPNWMWLYEDKSTHPANHGRIIKFWYPA